MTNGREPVMNEPPEAHAKLARASLARAKVATVTIETTPSLPAVTVKLSCDRLGRPLLHLRPDSGLVDALQEQSSVTLVVAAPTPYQTLSMRGSVSRTAQGDERRDTTYRVALESISLGSPEQIPVSVPAFHATELDSLWGFEKQMINHLHRDHGHELTECVRSHGVPSATAALVHSIDREGLNIAALTPDGITGLRLEFPDGAVTSLTQVAWQLRQCLTCRCQREDGGDSPSRHGRHLS